MRATTFRCSVLLTWMTCCYGNNSQCVCVRAWAFACEKKKIKCILNCDYCRNVNGHLFKFHQVHCQGRKKKQPISCLAPNCLLSRPESTRGLLPPRLCARSQTPLTSGECQRASHYTAQHCYSPTLQPAEPVVFVRKRVAKETRLQLLEHVLIL